MTPLNETTFTLADPRAAAKFGAGMHFLFKGAPPPWWRRLWRWARRGFKRAPRPRVLTVLSVDRATDMITLGSGER